MQEGMACPSGQALFPGAQYRQLVLTCTYAILSRINTLNRSHVLLNLWQHKTQLPDLMVNKIGVELVKTQKFRNLNTKIKQ